MSTRHYTVTGMTCGHCVASVTEEVREVPGVEQVDVRLDDGSMSVAGDAFDDSAVLDAVAEAGYEAAVA